ncbi:SdpI family protein [Hoyosella sp. YIM 151337]|uniref:SdpI family protein n=1 Tax=Hoyosella sp. YIM 151337 TaxID=2992742 RepID=UPI002235CDD0|nr:SdpI family protein [Hoyosella sp. YIM 151337]MCW4354812.1 SdpI family protein [Hoyosella sp. YIM 151337]
MLVAAIVLFLFAAYLLTSGIAGALQRLPRNRFFGVRAPETMRDDATFSLANKVAAPTMIGAATILTFGGVTGLILRGWVGAIVVVVTVVAAVVVAGAGANMGISAARRMPQPSSSGCSTCGGCSLAAACSPGDQCSDQS